MKKSLSILLSFALVFGLFASMASAADTELTVAQKYQALVDKGVLKGNPDGDARLDANLNRAEFATIAIAISGLAPEKPATATFSDVNSKQWWYGAIEAAAKAGLVEGYNGKFNPKNNVTVEEVIKVAVQAAGLETDEKAEAVEGASAWAAKYIKAALDAGLIATGLDYKADATRGQTILVGYSVYEKLNPTEATQVTVDAKAAGLKKVEVSLAKAVDTDKAVLTLKKGNTTVATETKFSEDKKSATLTLKDSKIGAGTYSVTLTGLAEADVAKATSEFTAEDETVKKIEFVTSSDEIAASKKAKVKISSQNQYGEQASFSASNYTINTTGLSSSLRKDSEGYLILTIDTDTTSNTHLIPSVSPIPVYITHDDTRVNAQKVFKLGTIPIASKLELGAVKYSNGKDQISAAGETATIVLKVSDQYGNPITPEQQVNINESAFILPYNEALSHEFKTDDDTYTLKVFVKGDKKVEKSDTYTVTVRAGTDSKNAEIKVNHGKVATKVKVADVVGGVLAEGDKTQYVTLEVADAEGNLLTSQEIAENADRIKISATGVASYKLVTVGKNKGKVQLNSVQVKKGGSVFVTASIATIYSQSHDYKGFKVDGVRIPDSIELTKPHAKAVLGGKSEVKFVVKDQYGATWNKNEAVGITLSDVYSIEIKMNNTNTTTTAVPAAGTLANGTPLLVHTGNSDFTNTNKAIAINTVGTDVGSTRFEAVLTHHKGGISGATTVLDTKVATIESIAPTSNLTYSLNDLGTMYAVYDAPAYIGLDNEATPANMLVSELSKAVELTVKDGAGEKVAVPNNLIKTLVSSNPNVLQVNATPANADAAKAIGIKTGSASVTAVVYAVDGTTKNLVTGVTVKNDPVTVASISSNGAVKVIGTGKNLATVLTDAEVVVKDQYGNDYKNAVPLAYNKLLNLSFTISDVVRASGTGTVLLDAAGNFDFSNANGVEGFTLNIVSADGKVVESIAID